MGGEEIVRLARPFLLDLPLEEMDDQWLAQVMDTVKDNIETLAEIREYLPIFLPGEFLLDNEARSVLAEDGALEAVKAMEEVVKGFDEMDEEAFAQIAAELKKRTGFKGKNLFAPIRAALTGRLEGPELKHILPLLGKGVILERLAQALR
jgi:nondiscriminating glutamyl-tRNA synthetase